jgi:hypothetical protein
MQDLGTWRTYRAGLVQRERAGRFWEEQAQLRQVLPALLQPSWAHEISQLERGCLLVARQPDMGPLLTQSVVLLLEHGAVPALFQHSLHAPLLRGRHAALR